MRLLQLDLYVEGLKFLPKGQLKQLHNPDTDAMKDHPILKYSVSF